MDRSFDVTVSVWNEFWAPELCEGLSRGGFRVLALRSESLPLCGVETKCCYPSKFVTRLFQRTHWPALLEGAQNTFESFAKRQVGKSTVFWGWNGHNHSAFQAAKLNGQMNICERGSTHAAWAAQRLKQVHRRLGWGPTHNDFQPREQRAIKEYELSDVIMVPSRFVQDTFLQEGVHEEKLRINPYGVDLDRWAAVSGSQRTEGPLVFIFTASMTPRKGVHILLEAWHEAQLEDAELWMCGGLHFPIKQLGIPVDANVKFLGYKQHAELLPIYDRAAVYVLPSFEEGMARSGIEALASGLPCIVTAETGLTDWMMTGDEGWLVESGNIECLTETLRHVAARRHNLPRHSSAARACTAQASKQAYGDRAAAMLEELIRRAK